MDIKRKYGQSATINFELINIDGIDFSSAATFAAGDVVIMKDEGAEANTTNLPTDEGTGYSLVLTAAEMSAARIAIYFVDQTATKVWLDRAIRIETYGNASAEHAFDLDTALVTLAAVTHTGATIPSVTTVATTTTNTDMRGTDGANTVVPNTVAPDNAGITANGAAIAALNDITALSVWDVLETAVLTASSMGLKVKTNLDGTVSSRLATAGYTAPDNAGIASNNTDIAAVKADTAAILVDTADMQPKLGTPSTDVSADIAAVKADSAAILVDTSTTLDTKINDIQGATFATATDSLEAIRNRGDAAWTTGAGGTPPDLLQNTTIATLASQTSFTLTAGSADDSAYIDALVVVTDSVTSVQKAVGTVSAYTGATKTVTLSADPGIFTMAVGDTIDIIASKAAGAGGGLTAQQTRDAMKLAPTAGAPAAGSVDEHLDVINVDTTTDIPAQITALNNFDPAVDAVANVTLVATTTTNTDMRGTDGAAVAGDAMALTTAADSSVAAAVWVNAGRTITGTVFIDAVQGPVTFTGTGNLAGLTLVGAGVGPGLQCTGGSGGGHGIDTQAVGASKHGINSSGSGGGNGAQFNGQAGGSGVVAVGGGSGNGAIFQGNLGAHGMQLIGGTSGGSGAFAVGFAGGHGFDLNGGANGDGINSTGGVTSGDGISATGQGSGVDIRGNITGNLSGSVNSVTTGVIVTTNNDKTGYTIAVGGIGSTAFAAGAIDSAAIAANAIDAAALATDAVTEIANGVHGTVIESQGGVTHTQFCQFMLSVLLGVTTTDGATFKTPNGQATRVVITYSGTTEERLTVALTP